MKFTETKVFMEQVQEKATDLDQYIEFKQHIDGIEKQIEECCSYFKTSEKNNLVPKILAFVLIKEHRTHQQSIIGNVYKALKIYAEKCGTDGRNQEAVEWAKKATKEETYFPYI